MMQALSDRTLRGASARLLNLRDRGTESLQDIAASGLAVPPKEDGLQPCGASSKHLAMSPFLGGLLYCVSTRFYPQPCHRPPPSATSLTWAIDIAMWGVEGQLTHQLLRKPRWIGSRSQLQIVTRLPFAGSRSPLRCPRRIPRILVEI